MKKIHSTQLISIFILAFTFFVSGCDDLNKTENPDENELLPDKIIWEPATAAEGTFITVSADAWESEGYIKNDFTGDAPVIYFENGIDLTGYKYLNIEAYSPDDGYHLLGFAGISDDPYEKVARIQAMGSKQPTVYQTDFGVNNKEWPDANTGTVVVKKSTSNIMNHMIIYSFDPFDEGTQDVPGVKICIKKITATNTKLTNDTSKDRVIFNATESGGHKFTTVNEDDESWETNFLYFGTNLDLEGYKYLNLEVCSPNCGNYSVNIESWNTSYKTDCERARKLEFSRILTSEMTVYQIPFGVFKEYWFDWTVSENYKKTIKDNILTYLYVSTQDTEKDWQWHGGIDVYIKSITATNTLLETPDTSKDKVVYSAIEPEGRKITTKEGWAYLDTGYYNLEGYDYLNFEIASPNSDFNVVNIYARDYCNDAVGHLESILTRGYNVIQIPFGKDKGTWEKWIGNTSSTVSFATNELRSLAIWATDQSAQNWPNVKNVDIYIKSITATNKKLEERVVFEAPSSSEGYKITTKKEWVNFYLGYSNLKGFKYLNIELYSPNNNNYAIEIDGWGGSPREDVADFEYVNLNENPRIIQVGFGTSREYWNAWVADKNDFEQRPTNSDDLNHFAIGARDSNGQLVEGIDIYIKRIWATNAELQN